MSFVVPRCEELQQQRQNRPAFLDAGIGQYRALCGLRHQAATWHTIDCGDALWSWLDGVRQANAKNRFGRLGNTVTAFVIRDGQVINAPDER